MGKCQAVHALERLSSSAIKRSEALTYHDEDVLGKPSAQCNGWMPGSVWYHLHDKRR